MLLIVLISVVGSEPSGARGPVGPWSKSKVIRPKRRLGLLWMTLMMAGLATWIRVKSGIESR